MSPSLPLILAFFFSTLPSITALPISTDQHKELLKRSPSSKRDVGIGFGITIAAILSLMIVFYLGFRRGKMGSWLWWRTPTPSESNAATKKMASPTLSFEPTIGRRSNTSTSGHTVTSPKPGLNRSTTGLSGKTISSPQTIHSSTFSPQFSSIPERSNENLQPVTERKLEDFGLGVEQVIHEIGTSSPRPTSALTATTTKSMTKSDWIRNTHMSTSTSGEYKRKSFWDAYRKSGFSDATTKEIRNPRPSLEERKTRGSFEDWRADYAPSRRMTHATYRTTGSKSFFCAAAAEIEEQDREYEALQVQLNDHLASQIALQLKEEKRVSEETLVSPVSPVVPKVPWTMPDTPPETPPETPPMPTSPTFPMPVVIKASPLIDGSEWSYGSEDEDGDEKEDELTMFRAKEMYAEKVSEEEMYAAKVSEEEMDAAEVCEEERYAQKVSEEMYLEKEVEKEMGSEKDGKEMSSEKDGEEMEPKKDGEETKPKKDDETRPKKEGEDEMDWAGLEWLRKVYNERRSRYLSGSNQFKTVYIGDS
ncbi:hypothetical protein P280DRAFT_27676 [Massarina eburnea CBS 473.64]|uniref:Uncharacterized protein n=1 Tax=Massarina eburnea CBS 473.64 TaxID=1395130 RepID=A0A6A6S0A1_9PLEO|nr:hypothetical protein P280DRAFT_27676 [Massarina eburnea CBS 473.64]